MLRFLIWTLAIIVITFLLMRVFERHMVFFPSKFPTGYWQAEEYGVAIQDAWMTASDSVKIHGWLVLHKAPVASLLMAHGNAGNVSDRVYWLRLLHENIPANLFMFDYRGYGRSAGTPTEEGCYRDAEAAHDWLRQKFPELPIIAHGHSLGGAVAIELACRRALAGLIVESCFTNAEDMARLMFGPLPLSWLTSMKWASSEKVTHLTLPKLFIHGDRDTVIPFELGQKLYAAAAEPKQFVTLRGADHNDTFVSGGERYFEVIGDFVRSCGQHGKL